MCVLSKKFTKKKTKKQMCSTVNKNTVSQEDKTHANSTTNSYYEILKTSNGLVNHLLLRGEVMEESPKPD